MDSPIASRTRSKKRIAEHLLRDEEVIKLHFPEKDWIVMIDNTEQHRMKRYRMKRYNNEYYRDDDSHFIANWIHEKAVNSFVPENWGFLSDGIPDVYTVYINREPDRNWWESHAGFIFVKVIKK